MSITKANIQPPSASHNLPTPSRSPIAEKVSTASDFHDKEDTTVIDPAPSIQYDASLHSQTIPASRASIASSHAAPSSNLRLHIDQVGQHNQSKDSGIPIAETSEKTHFNAGLPIRTSSIRSALGSRAHRSDSLSPASAVSFPGVGPLMEMTPLPSPLSIWAPPGLGRTYAETDPNPDTTIINSLQESSAEPVHFARGSPKKKGIAEYRTPVYDIDLSAHERNRSLSEYVPEGIQVPQSRNIIVSTSGAPLGIQSSLSPPSETYMHREQYLAVQRGLTVPVMKPPTPPDSTQGRNSDDLDTLETNDALVGETPSILYEARTVRKGFVRRWRALRHLGNGTFSRVMLATSENVEKPTTLLESINVDDEVSPKSLVAVKICEQGPAGGADEEKMATSIKRETELMKVIDHPCLVHLKAVSICERQTLLVLNYCPGGDLFELARSDLNVLVPSLIRRLFSELIAAVRYLHDQYIVHRDIKLENVLVNLPTAAFRTIGDWQSYPHPVVTLSDLGLGRRIPRPPDSPLLETRCGSEDYAAPEVLMGQEYDGRVTDAWALGVLLYSLMEGRLPFDPIPGARKKSPTSHRIARCEWQWVNWAGDDAEWDPVKGEKLNGAQDIVEGLLTRARNRWSLEKVQKTEWVARGIRVDGGLKREDNDDDDAL